MIFTNINRRLFNGLSSVLYFICFVLLAGMFLNALDALVFGHTVKILSGIAVVVFGYTATAMRCMTVSSTKRREQLMRCQLFFTFVFYLIMLVDFTLIDDGFGRNIFNVFTWSPAAAAEYIEESTNFIPFYTVRLFTDAYKYGSLPLYAVIENLIGNIVVFMPLPFFLHCLFKAFDKWYKVFPAVILSVFIVEALQFLFMTGSADIDDVILNVSGAVVFYLILKIKLVSKGISKLTFGVWKKVEEKN